MVSSAARVLKALYVEQMRRRRSARLNGMVFNVCNGWQEEYNRYICLSVGLVWRSVEILP